MKKTRASLKHKQKDEPMFNPLADTPDKPVRKKPVRKTMAQKNKKDFRYVPDPTAHNRTILNVMGIDPGLQDLGIAVVSFQHNQVKLSYHKKIKASNDIKEDQLLQSISNETYLATSRYNVHLLGHEQPFSAGDSQAFTQGMSLGAAFLGIMRKRGVLNPVRNKLSFMPVTVKKEITGNGKASKQDVEYFVRLILSLGPDHKMTEHEWDAAAIAITTAMTVFPDLKSVVAKLIRKNG